MYVYFSECREDFIQSVENQLGHMPEMGLMYFILNGWTFYNRKDTGPNIVNFLDKMHCRRKEGSTVYDVKWYGGVIVEILIAIMLI